MVVFDLLFIWYVNNTFEMTTGRFSGLFIPENLRLRCDGGGGNHERLDDCIRGLQEHRLHLRYNNLAYVRTRLCIADSSLHDQFYEYSRGLRYIRDVGLDATAGDALRLSDNVFPESECPLVVMKLFYEVGRV